MALIMMVIVADALSLSGRPAVPCTLVTSAWVTRQFGFVLRTVRTSVLLRMTFSRKRR